MYGCESWILKLSAEELMLLNSGVGEDLESPLDCKEIQPVYPKGNQFWIIIGRTDVKAETPILWPPDVKNWLIWKDPDAGKDWGQEEKGTSEDEMVWWHHRLNRHGFGWTPGVGDGQGGLACCASRGWKESDTTERLNWTELNLLLISDLFFLVFWISTMFLDLQLLENFRSCGPCLKHWEKSRPFLLYFSSNLQNYISSSWCVYKIFLWAKVFLVRFRICTLSLIYFF